MRGPIALTVSKSSSAEFHEYGCLELTLPAFLHSLATEVGNGLLIPKGILYIWTKPL